MFNENPEYLQLYEEDYKRYIEDVQKEHGKDYGVFSTLDFDDSGADIESLIRYINEKNGKPEIKMQAFHGEACICPCYNIKERDGEVCLKVVDDNISIRKDIKLIFGWFFDDEDGDTTDEFASEVCQGTYEDFRKAILTSSMEQKYEFMYHFDMSMGENLLVPYGCCDSVKMTEYSMEFNKLSAAE